MLGLLVRRPAFRRLWAASTVSLIGDWLAFVAISRLVLEQGGSAVALALVFAVHALPHAWFTPLAGVVADRVDWRRLLVSVPLVQALLTLTMALAASRGAVGLVQALVLVRSAFTAFMVPAEAAAIRHTVEPDELVSANALLSGTWSVTFVAGMALGGVIATLGPVPALGLDAASFVLSSLVATGLPAMHPDPEEAQKPLDVGAILRGVPRDLRAAFRRRAPRRPLFRAVFSKAPVAVAGGAGWLVLNLVADRVKPFGTAALSLGVLQAVRGAGTGIGPLCFAALSRGKPSTRAFEHAAALATFVGIASFPFAQGAPLALLLAALVWGSGGGGNWVLSSAALQRLAPHAMIGRLSGLDDLSCTSAMVGGAFLAALLLERGVSMQAVALLGTAIGCAAWVWLGRRR